jgi:hypothetical protein
MYRKASVTIPTVTGKITRKHGSDGSAYIYLETGRTYRKDKGYTIPTRVCIGKQDPKDSSRMFPNENYSEYFPVESVTTKEQQVLKLLDAMEKSGKTFEEVIRLIEL